MAARKRASNASTKESPTKKAAALKGPNDEASTQSPGSAKSVGRPRFTGWPTAAVAFYERLATDNSKSFWAANEETYERDVRGLFEALNAEIEDKFGPMHIFRPYRASGITAIRSGATTT